MIVDINDLPRVTLTPQNPVYTATVEMPAELLPPGMEVWLTKLGWIPYYSQGLDSKLFYRNDGPYSGGYYRWFEIVALETMNTLTLGGSRDAANMHVKEGGVAAATGFR